MKTAKQWASLLSENGPVNKTDFLNNAVEEVIQQAMDEAAAEMRQRAADEVLLTFPNQSRGQKRALKTMCYAILALPLAKGSE